MWDDTDVLALLTTLSSNEHIIVLGEKETLLAAQRTLVSFVLSHQRMARVLALLPDGAAELAQALAGEGFSMAEHTAAGNWLVLSPTAFQDATGLPDLNALEAALFDVQATLTAPNGRFYVVLDVAALLPHCARPSTLVDLEFRLEAWAQSLPALFLCCYNQQLFTAQELLSILNQHRVVVTTAGWRLNPQYTPFDPQLSAHLLEHRLQALLPGSYGIAMYAGALLGGEATARPLHAMVCVCSPEHRIEYANRQFRLYLGFDPVGQSCFEVLRDLGYPTPAGVSRHMVENEAIHWEVFNAKTQRWYYVVSVPWANREGDVGRQLLFQDITERRATEVEHERLLTTLHRRNLQLQTAARVSRSVTRILDPQQLMHRTVELIRESFNFYYVGVFLVDERGDYAVLQAGTGEEGAQMLRMGYRLPLHGSSMVSWAIAQGKPRIAWDVGQDEVRFDNPYLPQTRSEMALPLISRGRCIGAITIQGTAADAFTEDDLPVLQVIADHLSGAIENARLFEAAQKEIAARVEMEAALLRRNRELALLNRAGRALIAHLDLDQFLATVLAEVQSLLEAQSSSIWLLDAETHQLVCRQASGPRSDLVRGWRLDEGQGLVWWTVSRGRSLLVADVSQDPRFFPEVSQMAGIDVRSIVTVPLWGKQKVLGALQVLADRVERFDAAAVNLLESIAATITIVIENATLYEQARRDAETKSILLSEVNHRVKNNLMAIIGLLYAERRHAEISEQPLYQQIIDEMIVRLQGLTTVHAMLSEVDWMPLRLTELVEHVIRSTLETLSHSQQVSATVTSAEVRVTPTQAHNLALIINELVTNALRHALHDGGEVNLSVTITLDGQLLRLEFADDGPGFPPDVLQWQRYNVGMGLIRNLVQRTLGGEVFLSNRDGAVVTLVFRNEVV